MLRVGLTGSLGSGKSAAAQMFAAHGAYVLSADDIGRALMQPGQPVFLEILNRFGIEILAPDGTLNRTALARLAFDPTRPEALEALNAIIHPATIARQTEMVEEIAARDPAAVIVIESALIFETKFGGESGWQTRFDKIILVRASEDLKIARFIARAHPGPLTPEARAALVSEARLRLARQIDDDRKAPLSDHILTNNGPLDELQAQIDALWPILQSAAQSATHSASKPSP